MRGVMVVTGAPGTGKTTVAFQRVRFLFDQQNLREAEDVAAVYEPGLTAVFLANQNLIESSRQLLEEELGILRQRERELERLVHRVHAGTHVGNELIAARGEGRRADGYGAIPRSPCSAGNSTENLYRCRQYPR